MVIFQKKPGSKLHNRILKTLTIVEERGYSLILEKLSRNLFGGEMDKISFTKEIEGSKDFDVDR